MDGCDTLVDLLALLTLSICRTISYSYSTVSYDYCTKTVRISIAWPRGVLQYVLQNPPAKSAASHFPEWYYKSGTDKISPLGITIIAAELKFLRNCNTFSRIITIFAT